MQQEDSYLTNQLITNVFVEQPQAFPGSAKYQRPQCDGNGNSKFIDYSDKLVQYRAALNTQMKAFNIKSKQIPVVPPKK